LRVPIATEEERALFQRRLAITGMVVTMLGGGFLVITLVLVSITAPARVPRLFTDRSSVAHILTTLAAAAIWLTIRRGKPSVNVLSTIDFVVGIGLSFGWTTMAMSGIHVVQRPELIAILACLLTLVVRAALIPSTPFRSALIGVIGVAPLIAVTTSIYAGTDLLTVIPKDDQWLPPAVGVAIWATLGITATTVISHVIYGLRQEIRKAMQLGQYLLEEKIGEGGMGVVYRASHAMLRRPTAIKLLSGTTGQAAERFEREVQITARLTHPNTVAVFDYGRTPEGVFYYAMEYLDGISLEDLVNEHGPQPARRVAHILGQICGALEEAHGAGLVHRDIKPANIMLTQRGGVDDVVKVLDFGLVKDNAVSDVGKQDPALSTVNAIMGTPHYMAPEAILDPASIDGRADLYAVGATAYFLLTGEHVFNGTTLIEVCSQHLHEKPNPPSDKQSDVPKALDQVVLSCLAKKGAERPKDAATLASMIRACALGEWTRDEAAAWWTPVRAAKSDRAARSKGEAETSAFAKTITVALLDREAS
jgi:serine/threonine-protein kinase